MQVLEPLSLLLPRVYPSRNLESGVRHELDCRGSVGQMPAPVVLIITCYLSDPGESFKPDNKTVCQLTLSAFSHSFPSEPLERSDLLLHVHAQSLCVLVHAFVPFWHEFTSQLACSMSSMLEATSQSPNLPLARRSSQDPPLSTQTAELSPAFASGALGLWHRIQPSTVSTKQDCHLDFRTGSFLLPHLPIHGQPSS